MNHLQMEYFITLCQNMSFTQTAKLLYISQPALSKQISSLEKDLGVPLFERTYRNLSLTPAGQFLYEELSKIQADIECAVNKTKQIHAQREKSITTAFLSGWNIACFIPNASDLISGEYQDMRLALQSETSSRLLRALATNSVDVIVTSSAELEDVPGITQHELGNVHVRLFYSRKHPLAKKDSIRFEDFKDETFFCLIREESIYAEKMTLAHCARYGFAPRLQYLPNIESMITSLQTGLGVLLFDTLHKLSGNPGFKSLDLPLTQGVSAAWKASNQNPNILYFVHALSLIEL